MSEIALIDNKAILFDFWKDIPIIQKLTVKEKETVLKSDIRNQIVAALTSGIEDTHPNTKNKQIRHGMSANELYKIVKKALPDQNIKPPIIYFHLDTLSEMNMVQELGVIQRGKRFTTYYGRTSRMTFVKAESEENKSSVFETKGFHDLVKLFSPEIKKTEIEEIVSSIGRINCDTSDSIEAWFEKNAIILTNASIDNQVVYEIFSLIMRYNSEVQDALNKLSNILKIDTSTQLT